VIAFADLLERLLFTPGRLAKIALLRRYFATQPDPERGLGLAAITGALTFSAAKAGLIRELAAAEPIRCCSPCPMISWATSRRRWR
jgi:DNA ligase-1